MSEDDQLEMIQRAAFGKQVDLFLSSDIGKYMLARAREQVVEAQLQFRKADVTNVAVMTAIQNKLVVADSIVQWLKDAVSDGLQALNILEDRS